MADRPWTDEEDAILKEWTGTYVELGERLGRSAMSVRNRYRRMKTKGLVGEREKIGAGRSWTPEEDGELMGWQGTDKELAAKLGRSEVSVSKRRRRLKGDISAQLKATKTSHVEVAGDGASTEAAPARKAPEDFDDWPFWKDWPRELHITDVPVFDIEQLAGGTRSRASHGALVYGGEPHVRRHALKMLQMMTDDEQRALARALDVPSAAKKSRHARMSVLLGQEYLVEELYRYH